MFRGPKSWLPVDDTSDFYVMMTSDGTAVRLPATHSKEEFHSWWTVEPVSFPVALSLRMWWASVDDCFEHSINSGASAIINALLDGKLKSPMSVYGAVVFTGQASGPSSCLPPSVSLSDEALVVVYSRLVSEMESTYND